jgi:uncharacterized membrane protein YbhN (UPF0104 family)
MSGRDDDAGRGAGEGRGPLGGRWRIVAFALALAAGVAFAVWRSPDLGEVLDAFSGVRWPYVLLATLANAVSITCHGLVWRLTLYQALEGSSPPVRNVLAAHWIGALGNLLFPARAGEATRVGVVLRHVERGGAWPAVAGSALAHRLLEAGPAALLVVVVLLTAPVPDWARTLLVVLAGVLIVLLVLAVLLARRRGDVEREQDDDEGIVARLRRGLGVLRAPLPTGLALLAATGAIAFQLVGLWLVLLAFELDVPIAAAGVVLVLAEVVVLFPLWPGNVGVYQAVIAGGLAPFGVPYTTGLAYGLATQGLDAAVAATAGAAGLAIEGAGIAELRGGSGKGEAGA